MSKIVAIGAHPDDIELGCSGSLRKFILAGHEVFYVIATAGEKGGDNEIRKKEMQEAINLLGIKMENVFTLNLNDTMIMDDGNTVNLIENILKKINPDFVFTTSPSDRHQDHRNLSNAVLSATRHMSCTILFYETPSTTIEFRPTAFIDISDVLDHKTKVIEAYKSQGEKYYMLNESTIGLAKFRGNQIAVKHAEAFEVNKMIFKM